MKITSFLLAIMLSMSVFGQQTLRRGLGADLPPGMIMPFAGIVCPAGFLQADGTEISRTTYKSLFAAISTFHGSGNGTTTFLLPDYRGRFLRGVDGSANNDPDKASRTAMAPGGAVGNSVGSVQADALISHLHTMTITGTSGDGGTGVPYNRGGDGSVFSSGTASTNNAGGNETRPRNAYVTYCVKY